METGRREYGRLRDATSRNDEEEEEIEQQSRGKAPRTGLPPMNGHVRVGESLRHFDSLFFERILEVIAAHMRHAVRPAPTDHPSRRRGVIGAPELLPHFRPQF